MCTIVLLRRPGHDWPLMIGANRDEMLDRPWRPPGRHWLDRPQVVAGRDETAGGTWLGVNDAGVVAAVSNRQGSLGPAPGKRSRGELPLLALDHGDAAAAVDALAGLDGDAYRAFNLVVADRQRAYWLRHRGDGGTIERFEVPSGVSMLTSRDLDDSQSPRIREFLPRFRSARAPEPDDWGAWEDLLASRDTGSEGAPEAAMALSGETGLGAGFGTVSSSLIALPGGPGPVQTPVWRFAAGRPGTVPYLPLTL